ncbi:MAG: AraC family transcriptional regulator, partial [Sterolibacterium sp.]
MRQHTHEHLEGELFVSLTEPLVPVPLPALVVQLALEKGAKIDGLLAGTGLRPEHFGHPDTRLSYAQIAVIVARAMAQTGDAGFGLAFGQRIRLSHLAELGTALGCAPTLGEALKTTIRYQKLLGSAFDMRLVDLGEKIAMVASKSIPLGANYRFNQETWLTTIARLSVRLVERDLPELRADFDYPAPPHAGRYREVFGAGVKFGQGCCQVVFPKQLLALALPGASPSCFR